MNEAIKIAVEKGGYRPTFALMEMSEKENWPLDVLVETVAKADTIIDPSFWQALSQALGWEEEDKESERMWFRTGAFNPMPKGMLKWQQVAKKYFDLILTGGDTKAFWDGLLTQNNHDKT